MIVFIVHINQRKRSCLFFEEMWASFMEGLKNSVAFYGTYFVLQQQGHMWKLIISLNIDWLSCICGHQIIRNIDDEFHRDGLFDVSYPIFKDILLLRLQLIYWSISYEEASDMLVIIWAVKGLEIFIIFFDHNQLFLCHFPQIRIFGGIE